MFLESLAVLALASFGGGEGDKITKPKSIRIRCKEDARVRGTHVLLRDLAEIHAPDAARTKRLMALSFGRRPNSSYNRIVTRQEVLVRLYKANPALEAVLGLQADPDVEYKLRSLLRTMRVPPGRISLDFKAEVNGLPSESSARIDVKILVDDEVFKVVPVHYQLKRFYSVLITKGVLRKDTAFGPHNLTLKRVEKPIGSTIYLTSFDQVSERVTSRNLRSGHMLTLSDLALPAVIRKNQVVTLVSVSGRIRTATRVIALADGGVGSFIRVQTMHANSPRQLVAKVHAPGVCVIEPLR
ncbi:MAG: flagellar basal body P-ring formation chaperone FlgA [Planctomycetota bacterium]|jgi:flagella basal body P-ring formation protein FlgA